VELRSELSTPGTESAEKTFVTVDGSPRRNV
jgi:hypothetical protein